jgi:hypothetical protein
LALIGTLGQAAVVLAALTAIGLPAPIGSATPDSFVVRAWDAIASSGSGAVAADVGLQTGSANTGSASTTTTTGSLALAGVVPLPKGGGPLANGLLMSLVLISSLGLMIGRTLFKVARLTSGP